MKLDRMLVVALLAGILVLSPSAYGITISVGSNAGGFTENINACDKDSVFSSTVIAANGLSHSIEGSGSLRESHSVSNTAGANAEVGVDIRKAKWYSYSYDLWPGQGSSWPASRFAQVAASEQLDVLNAKYIQAYANALNSKGYSAGVSTLVSDPGKEASLTGYRNQAMASKDEAFASQTAESAFSPDGFILADSGADFTQLKLRPPQFREDTADVSVRVDSGSVEVYSDLAWASAYGVTASQHMDSANGDQIRTGSESASWTASLFQGRKTAGAKVSTRAEGTLTGYNAGAESSEDYAQADQAGHIAGTFTSTAVSGKASKTRTSNYGTEYDFNMQAKKDASGSYATGNLGYYVDYVSPISNRIQGAVDASESGDVINVAPGTYFENMQIDKSLNVLGAGASDTIVDGQQNGPVFTIGSQDNTGLDVALAGMTVQNGSGTTAENDAGEVYSHGGGILNHANLMIEDSIISGNNANWQGTGYGSAYGGGIYNSGTLYMDSSSVSGNIAKASGYGGAAYGGGIFNIGMASLDNSDISGNTALGEGSGTDYGDGFANGGGIHNAGNLNIKDSHICSNTAKGYANGVIQGYGQGAGGGILSSGNLNIDDSYICNNTATGYASGNSAFGSGVGGGIFGIGSTLNIAGSCISGNIAKGYASGISGFNDGEGGGIFSFCTLNIVESSISGNIAEAYGTGEGFEGLGGGIINLDTLNLEGVSISDNKAFRGGGIYNYGMVNLESGSIDNNSATQDGGGIFNEGSIIGNRSIVHDNSPNDIWL